MILVCGENLIDYILEDGEGDLPLYRATPGGSPFNTAMAMARQDIPTGYLNPISNDVLGQLLRSTLEKDGVACLAPVSDKPTALAIVSLDNGQPSYQFYHEDTADRQITKDKLLSITPDNVSACQVGCSAIGAGQDAEEVVKYIEALAARGVTITFDPNIRPAFIDNRDDYLKRFERILDQTRILKLSDEDITWLYPDQTIENAAKSLSERDNIELTVLTKGGDGAIAFSAQGSHEVAPASVSNLIDTVGAGDTFMATLVAETSKRGLLEKGKLSTAPSLEIDTVLQMAARAAAINCGRKGCNPPTTAELNT